MTPAVPEVNHGVGMSFKGTAAYLLHDVDAKTSERVAWVETRNLACEGDGELAWRLMAATAMNADKLKQDHHEREQAALPEDERSAYKRSKASRNHVFHYSLAWHPDEEMELSREEMMRAAHASIRELKADHLQAMIVCHQDRDHAHVHVMLNRVDPETGKIVPVDGNAQRKLSRFALNYERERGVILCPQREIHADMRKRGIPYVAEKRVPRLVYEQQRAARTDAETNPAKAEAIKAAQRVKDTTLSKQGRDMVGRHRDQWDTLGRHHRFRKAMINDEATQAKSEAEQQISKAGMPEWKALQEQQRKDREQQAQNERSLLGKLKNTASAVRAVWKRDPEEAVPRKLVSGTFGVLSNSGARQQALKREQEKERDKLAAKQRKEIAAARKQIEAERKRAIAENFERFRRDRADLELKQKVDRAAQRSRWATRDASRKEAWRAFVEGERYKRDYVKAAALREDAARKDTSRGPEPTKDRNPKG